MYVCKFVLLFCFLTTTIVRVLFSFFHFFVLFSSLEMSLFPSIFVPLLFSLCMESTSYVFSFPMVFFYVVTTGWIFEISLLCEN